MSRSYKNNFAVMMVALTILAATQAHAQIVFNSGGKTAEISQNPSTGGVEFKITNTEKLRIESSGRFVAAGGIQVGEEASCSFVNEGEINYKASTDKWQYCDGFGWQDFAGVAPCKVFADSINIPDKNQQALNTVITSAWTQIMTDGCTADVSISGDGSPQWRVCSNTLCAGAGEPIQNWTSSAGTIDSGNYIQVRLTSSASNMTQRVARLNISTVYDEWGVMTAPSHYRVFVTSVGYSGQNAGVGGDGGADHKCTSLANAAGLPGVYKAWISGDTIGEDRIYHSTVPYRLVDNTTTIASSYNDMVDGTLTNPINKTETGTTVAAGTRVWTNTDETGWFDTAVNDCGGFGISTGNGNGNYGLADQVNASWTTSGTAACNQTYRLYCFEQPYDPPGTAGVDYKRVFVTGTGYSASAIGGISGADTKCNTLASAAGLSGSYKAWMADSSVGTAPTNAARGFTKADVPYRLVDGRRIADDWTSLVGGYELQTGISLTQTGAYIAPSGVWTNVTYNGSQENATGNCSNWTSNAGTNGNYGTSGSSSSWTDDWNATCNQAYRFYCFEQ